jgi:hypothetical protein
LGTGGRSDRGGSVGMGGFVMIVIIRPLELKIDETLRRPLRPDAHERE